MSRNARPRSSSARVLGAWLFITMSLLLGNANALHTQRSPDAEAIAVNASHPDMVALLLDSEAVAAPESRRSSAPPDHVAATLTAARRFRSVEMNPQATAPDALAEGDTLYLGLFDDVHLWAVIDSVSTDINGVQAIRGRIEGADFGTILLSVSAGRVLARIEIAERQQEYVISDFGKPIGHVVQEIDPDLKDVLEEGPPQLLPLDGLQKSTRAQRFPSAGESSGTRDTVDLMIVYTPAAREWADSEATSVNHVINQSIARGQMALDNSQIGITLNLTAAMEVSYTESASSLTDLYRLTFHAGYDPWSLEGEPRHMDEVHRWRDTHGADLVALFSRANDVGGVGWLLNTAGGWPELGFQVVRVQQAHTSYTYIHEIGHTLGAHHHKAQLYQPGPGLYPYSAGWRWTGTDGGRYCSVMTYESGLYFPDGLTHVAIPYFSSPSLTFSGTATGDTTDGDNSRTLMSTKAAVASYRPPRVVDFVVTDISLTPSSPEAGGVFTAKVTVKNKGTVEADGGRLSVWVNQAASVACAATGTQGQTVGTLAAGASAALEFTSLPAGAAGTSTFRAFVDSACATVESNEANNQSTLSYTVEGVPTAFVATAVGVWRPGTGRFYLDFDGSFTWTSGVDLITDSFGLPTDLPVAGDWNGDGIDEIGVWRPSTGRFYLDIDGSRTWTAGVDRITASFGIPTDRPVAGDWNGDGIDDIGMWRPSTGRFYLDIDGSRTWTAGVDLITASFGIPTDRPMTGDWNGDGIDDIGVWRPGTGRFYLDIDGGRTWTAGVDVITDAFGIPSDHPVAGDWNGDGIDDIGVWRPSSGRYYLDIDGSRTWTTGVDLVSAPFGVATDLPVAGRW